MSLVEELKKNLAGLSALEGLQLISDKYAQGAVFSTSLGIEDQVISHLIFRNDFSIGVFTLDTGRLFQETYDVLDSTKRKYKKPIKVFYPKHEDVEALLEEKGPNSFYESVENRKECCFVRKIKPLKRALAGNKIWITGLRRDQSENRDAMQLVEYDSGNQIIKYNPLLDWTKEDVDAFVKENHVPVNRLHGKGYVSIGCAPCTRAIREGESFRDGRWWWETSKKECGLHQAN